MKFAFVSDVGSTVTWWLRLIAEGHEVRAWIIKPLYKKFADGLVSKVDSLYALKQWGGKDALYIFDLNGNGPMADNMRKQGYRVFGGGVLCDKLEKNRRWGDDIAQMAGMKLPKSTDFKTIDDAISQAQGFPKETGWYFKSDKLLDESSTFGAPDPASLVRYLNQVKKKFGNSVHGVLQQKLEGVVVNTAWWWNGKGMTNLWGEIENKKVWTGDVGPTSGCAINLVWPYVKEPRLANLLHLDKCEALFRKLDFPIGPCDVNVIINKEDKQPYFLEWGPRIGYDEDLTWLAGLEMDLAETLFAVSSGGRLMPFNPEEYWFGLRLSVPPYPWEHIQKEENAKTALGVPIDGVPDVVGESFAPYGIAKGEDGFELGDPEGLVGVALAQGTSLRQMDKEALAVAKKLVVPNLQYRTDALPYMAENLRLLKGWGYTNEMPKWSD